MRARRALRARAGMALGGWLERDQAIAGCFAIAACLIHVLLDGRYGYFRDELYYAACGQHLAWGYVDQAPLIAVCGAAIARSVWRVALRAAIFSGAGRGSEDFAHRMDRPGTWRQPLRAVAGGHGRAGLPDLSDDGQFPVHECLRAAVLDAVRRHFPAHRAHSKSAPVAAIRACGRNWNPEQAFDAAVRVCLPAFAADDSRAAPIARAVDLGWSGASRS